MLDFAALFRPLVEQGNLLYFVYHLEAGRMLYLSQAYQRIFGNDPAAANEELPRIVARIHPEDEAYAKGCYAHLLHHEFLEDVELRLVNAEDQLQWLCISAGRVHHAEGQTYLSGTVEDITAAREYNINADRFNKKKNSTLEILSHDLAGPFAMLQQMSEYVGERVETLHDAQLNELLQTMQSMCRDSVNLIRDFVDTEFLVSSNVDMKTERADLVTELREMLQDYHNSEKYLAKQFVFRAGTETAYAELDKNKFMQVINNLLSNSIKFTPDGGLIEVSVAQGAEHVIVTVADNGIGIPADKIPVLYDRFTSARRPGLRGEKTTGLGMSIIRTLVELHRGTIRCESEENRGTVFTIELPRAKPYSG